MSEGEAMAVGTARLLRLAVPVAAMLATGLLLATVSLLLGLARPRLTWTLSAASNVLHLVVAPGQGPLAAWVAARTAVDLPGHGSGHQLLVPVRPGEHLSWHVALRGPSSTTVPLLLTVPSPPSLRSTVARPDAMVLRFDTTVQQVTGYRGATLCGSRSVCLARGVAATTARLRVTATTGEAAWVQVGVPGLPAAPVFWSGDPTGRRVYLTIDDGWYPSPKVLALVRATHLPLTTFLVTRATGRHLAYYRALARAGVHIEDHTVSHPQMPALGLGGQVGEWARNRSQAQSWFGAAPTLGRPPYGAMDRSTRIAAARAGLRALVMWNAQVGPDGRLTTWNHQGLAPGDIVLLHWGPGLSAGLDTVLRAVRAQHLTPAYLTPQALGQSGVASAG